MTWLPVPQCPCSSSCLPFTHPSYFYFLKVILVSTTKCHLGTLSRHTTFFSYPSFISSVIMCVSYSLNQAVSSLWKLPMFHYFHAPYRFLCPRIIQKVLFCCLLKKMLTLHPSLNNSTYKLSYSSLLNVKLPNVHSHTDEKWGGVYFLGNKTGYPMP